MSAIWTFFASGYVINFIHETNQIKYSVSHIKPLLQIYFVYCPAHSLIVLNTNMLLCIEQQKHNNVYDYIYIFFQDFQHY